MKSALPELPWERRTRYTEMGLAQDALDVFIQDQELATLFENTIILFDKDTAKIQLAANYLVSDLMGMVKNEEDGRSLLRKLRPEQFARLIEMTHAGEVNSRATKDILALLVTEGGNPLTIATERGLLQQNDTQALQTIAQTILSENTQAVEDYKAGKETSIKFLVGQAMKATKGSANPQMMEKLFVKLIG